MSEAEDAEETDAETPEEPEGPEGPDLGDEDMAEIPADVAEKVAEETEAESADPEPSETEETDSEESKGSDEPPSPDAPDTNRIGEIYCRTLGLGAAYGRESYGDGLDGEEREDVVEEYVELAQDLDLDQYVSEWWEENAGSDDLSPTQGVLAMTGLFAVVVLLEDGELADNLAGQMGDSDE